jgi:hypothetical protein
MITETTIAASREYYGGATSLSRSGCAAVNPDLRISGLRVRCCLDSPQASYTRVDAAAVWDGA